MTALHNFIRAAASYYGVPVGQLTEGCAIDSSTGEFEVVLRFALTPDDLAGVAKRMATMLQEQAVDEAIAAQQAEHKAMPTRADWDMLTAAERSAYGSFARFKAQYVPPVEKVELPAHVWLERGEATPTQMSMAVGMDEKGRVAVDPADLTNEQRAKRAGQFSILTEGLR